MTTKTTTTRKTIHWFRQDLRLTDNPALHNSANQGEVICIYIHNPKSSIALGEAGKWWLYKSLHDLNKQLKGKLRCFNGSPSNILDALVTETGATSISWNQGFTPEQRLEEQEIEALLTEKGIRVNTCNGSLLFPPNTVFKKDGSPYKVFSAYYKQVVTQHAIQFPLTKAEVFDNNPCPNQVVPIDSLTLLSTTNWYTNLERNCQPGEISAKEKLSDFLNTRLKNYSEYRDNPAIQSTSEISAHLHFGEISPQQIWYSTQKNCSAPNIEKFLRQLVWRDFSYYQLYHFKELSKKHLKPAFDNFPYRYNSAQLKQWQQGKTGIPIIDAGMRELWKTGNMHNRVRLLTASFLVKNLRMHWRYGAAWFLDCLVDADLANNSANWQWVAGSGCDAAPYFRIFNPELQSRKFDTNGEYIRLYCPELTKLSNKEIHAPWLCTDEVLKAANITLGKTYPMPIVDLKLSRLEALEALRIMNSKK